MNAMKHCNLCGQTKPLSEFYTLANGKPRAGCKSCLCAASKIQQKGYYRKNPEGCKARQRRWAKRHLDEAREIGRVAMQHWRDGQKNLGQTSFGFLPSAQGRKNTRGANSQ